MIIAIMLFTYLITIYLLYMLFFRKIVFPIKNHIFIIFQNDGEIRGGGGLITLTAEIRTFLGIPYSFIRHGFNDINNYKENFFSPFSEKLSMHLIFRDTNHSIFQDENVSRFVHFYKKIFPGNDIPKTWLIINYTFVENLFRFIPPFKLGSFNIRRSSLFKTLSHLVGDNDLGGNKRKDVIFSLIPRILILFIIPFFPHLMLVLGKIGLNKKDMVLVGYDEKIPRSPIYISIAENNLIGRKGNRYIENSLGFDFFIQDVNEENISGTGKIRISKRLFAEESFPLSGTYRFVLLPVFSKHFSFDESDYRYFEFGPNGSFYHEISFEFNLPRTGFIDILKQDGLQNTNITANFQTKMFQYLPITNLPSKKDHWHSLNKSFTKNLRLVYDLMSDNSALRLIHRTIISPGILQISFQKSVIPSKSNFLFTYEGSIIDIKEVITEDEGKTLIFFISDPDSIPYYTSLEKNTVLKVEMSNIKDVTGMIHYGNVSRKNWLPWSENYIR
ncbi:MAG: hypothetical protein PHS92_03780 [Candidatus Gracilibacteria bacterium]|nr:hypothetical protein [Candidatus Gracilibacteria bacterium]